MFKFLTILSLSLMLSFPVLANDSMQCYSVKQSLAYLEGYGMDVEILRLSSEQAEKLLDGLHYPMSREDVGEVVVFALEGNGIPVGVDVVVFDLQGCYVRDKVISFDAYRQIMGGLDV